MAEVAAGLWAAEEVVSTGIQAGAAGYAVAKPTMPLKAAFKQIGATSDDTSRSSLTRSHHTLTLIGDKAYIFGGQTHDGKLASTNMHTVALPIKGVAGPDYQVLPAIAVQEGGPVPAARTKHAACALGNRVAVHGGSDESGKPIDEGSKIWLYDTEKLAWDSMEPGSHPERVPPPRSKGYMFAHDGNLVLYGGMNAKGDALTDVWHFDCFTKIWNQLPMAPVATDSVALARDTLYLVDGTDALSSVVHHLDVKLHGSQPPEWAKTAFPTNPLAPGPRQRKNAGLLPVTTGFGRNYLLYFFGDRHGDADKGDSLQWDDLWTFQLPSSDLEVKPTVNMNEAVKPAKIKDQIRDKLGADTGGSSWAEVEVQAPGDLQAHEGKAHPGPRSSFGCNVTSDGKHVVLWGGVNAKGQAEGDGWIIELW
ncbi:hypothetical protein F4780DRAFT_562432 [Xylariomycetidae sp. FL0641]|nr:hypothetical protein F4780DRAFT_562432 [Xylariomycetidae sp. FL0641]